jgi:Family of unknown function (DUF5678)
MGRWRKEASMKTRLLRILGGLASLAYPGRVAIARREPGDRVPPVPRPKNLDQYQNQWVAVLRGEVVAHGSSSGELAVELKKLGAQGQDAVMQYVRPPVSGYVVGVG